jgi:3-oxoadipyl-CoA thiolase
MMLAILRDALICDAVRTPIGRFGGLLSSVRADDLAAVPIRALMARHPKADWDALDEVLYGCANQAGEDNRNVARMAVLLAELAPSVPATTINRLCGSSLDALAQAARAIRVGDMDLVIAGGVESMTRAPFVMGKADTAFARTARIEDTTMGWRFVNPLIKERFGIDSMPETAENLARELHIARVDQDAFALRSQERCARAKSAGHFAAEITPVRVPLGRNETRTVSDDEHPRPDTTLDTLAKLKPIVAPDGTVTAGNSSGINDGASALLLASEEGCRRHGLEPRARIVGAATAGVMPRVMGIGPVPATRRLLERTGVALTDIDLIELNEAFAAQSLAVLRELGLPDDAAHVNPLGGAIALGHPLGASGARIATTALHQLGRMQARYALCTMCIGVGQGISVLIERV